MLERPILFYDVDFLFLSPIYVFTIKNIKYMSITKTKTCRFYIFFASFTLKLNFKETLMLILDFTIGRKSALLKQISAENFPKKLVLIIDMDK